MPAGLYRKLSDMVNGIADHAVDFHQPVDHFALDDGGGQVDLPGLHSGGAFILDQQPVQEGGARAEITNNKNRLLDVLIFHMREKQVIQAIGQPKTIMPKEIKEENKQENEKPFGRKPSGVAFRFEEAYVNGFEE